MSLRLSSIGIRLPLGGEAFVLLQAVDDELGNTLVATMLYLDSENKKDINMYINASGGDVVPCLALHDTMKHIGSDVATVGFGGVMGMSGFLLACGASSSTLPLVHTADLLPQGVCATPSVWSCHKDSFCMRLLLSALMTLAMHRVHTYAPQPCLGGMKQEDT